MYGIHHKCKSCLDFNSCYECYNSTHLTHPDHGFETIGPKYEVVPEQTLREAESNTLEDDKSEDEDTDTDESS